METREEERGCSGERTFLGTTRGSESSDQLKDTDDIIKYSKIRNSLPVAVREEYYAKIRAKIFQGNNVES